MECYKEISLEEVFKRILNDDYDDIYYQHYDGQLFNAKYNEWRFDSLKNRKWFVREEVVFSVRNCD